MSRLFLHRSPPILLSGEKQIEHQSIAERLQAHEPEMLGVEQEGSDHMQDGEDGVNNCRLKGDSLHLNPSAEATDWTR